MVEQNTNDPPPMYVLVTFSKGGIVDEVIGPFYSYEAVDAWMAVNGPPISHTHRVLTRPNAPATIIVTNEDGRTKIGPFLSLKDAEKWGKAHLTGPYAIEAGPCIHSYGGGNAR